MGTLAVVVPVLNERHLLDVQCANFNRLSEICDELLFVDGGSEDGTMEWLVDNNFIVVPSKKGRALQMNCGAERVNSTFILFLHADSRLAENFDFSTFVLPQNFNWGAFQVELIGEHRLLPWVSSGINFRSKLFGVFTGDQGLLVRRSFFNEIGKFQDIPLMEDIEFSRRAKKFCRGILFPQLIYSSGRYWDKYGLLRSVIKMWYLQLLFKLGVSPEYLHRQYYVAQKSMQSADLSQNGH